MKTPTVVLITTIAAVAATELYGQTLFTNGIDVAGNYVYGNGYIPVEGGVDGQTNAAVRDIAPSIGQMAGVDPDTGGALTNGEFFTLKPKALDLSVPANRQFVISAAQILGSGTVQISYNGTNIIFTVPTNSISTSQLDLPAIDARYFEQTGDTL